MKYCEDCKTLVPEGCCPYCGSEKLREVEEGDFCFLAESQKNFGEMLEGVFKEEGIDCILMPWGNGVMTALGMQLDNYKIYVRFKDIESAYGLLKEYIGEPETDKLRKKILDNVDNWHIKREATAKKIIKKLKAGRDEDVFAVVKNAVERSDSIHDRGLMNTFATPEHGIAVSVDNVVLWFSDESFEIQI